jgi:hypothetical protein
VPKDKRLILFAEDDLCIDAFHHRENGKDYFVPEPDPILVYFNNAQVNVKNVLKYRKTFLSALEPKARMLTTDVSHNLFAFFGSSSTYAILVYTALEAVVNKVIPFDYKCERKTHKNTELFDYAQMQRHLSFDDKIIALETVTNKNFKKAHPQKNQYIENLKIFRNEIVHTKHTDKHSPYGYMLVTALKFKYKETLEAVADFINFYVPGLVEPCNCGDDF